MANDTRYQERCLRAIGIMSLERLEVIRRTPVAVAGLGLGGSIFINLVRLGFEDFHVADPDTYERTNINRQRAAKEITVGSRKDDCLIQEAYAINPNIRVKAFRGGVKPENVKEFVEGRGWIVDAVDVFAIPDKIALHEEATARGVPIVTCGAVGFGTSVVVFDRTTPTFLELAGLTKDASFEINMDRFVRFLVPEVPPYMRAQVQKAMNRSSHIPFVVCGVENAASLVCTEMCKHMVGLGERVLAPQGIFYDPVAVKLERFTADYREREGENLFQQAA